MERPSSPPQHSCARLLAAVCIAASAIGTGCYQAKPAKGTIDLTDVPDKVAKVVPLQMLPIDFQIQPLNATSAPIKLTLKNIGPYPATQLGPASEGTAVNLPYLFEGGTYPGTGGTCTDRLDPDATCDIQLTYTPLTTGPHEDVLNLSYVNGASHIPLPIPLLGTTPADLVFPYAPPYDVGNLLVGSTLDTLLTVRNSGGAEAILASAEIVEPTGAPQVFSLTGNAFPGAGGTCDPAVPLAPGQSCTLSLHFAPTLPVTYTGYDLDLEYDDGLGEQTASLGLRGAGM